MMDHAAHYAARPGVAAADLEDTGTTREAPAGTGDLQYGATVPFRGLNKSITLPWTVPLADLIRCHQCAVLATDGVSDGH